VFQAAGQDCAGCHEDIHAGQFSGRSKGADCARCHGVLAWKPTRLDHNRDSSFPLTGAHSGVACALCHKATRQVNNKLVVVYKGAVRECKDCHGSIASD
jgi:hypothetical protein